MTALRFELMVYDESGDHLVTARSVLDTMAADPARTWNTPFDATLALVVADGPEWIAPHWNLGRPDLLAPQLHEAARRLGEGMRAVVRSAILDEMQVPYLVFEAFGDDVLCSLISLTDPGLGVVFPVGPRDARAHQLYAHVFRKLPAHIKRIRRARGAGYFSRVAAPRQALAEQMQRAADEADALSAAPSH